LSPACARRVCRLRCVTQRFAVVGTLGVVVPSSLVLILWQSMRLGARIASSTRKTCSVPPSFLRPCSWR